MWEPEFSCFLCHLTILLSITFDTISHYFSHSRAVHQTAKFFFIHTSENHHDFVFVLLSTWNWRFSIINLLNLKFLIIYFSCYSCFHKLFYFHHQSYAYGFQRDFWRKCSRWNWVRNIELFHEIFLLTVQILLGIFCLTMIVLSLLSIKAVEKVSTLMFGHNSDVFNKFSLSDNMLSFYHWRSEKLLKPLW